MRKRRPWRMRVGCILAGVASVTGSEEVFARGREDSVCDVGVVVVVVVVGERRKKIVDAAAVGFRCCQDLELMVCCCYR